MSLARHPRTPVFANGEEQFELYRVGPFAGKDRWNVQGFLVTSPTRTLLDLGSTTATGDDLRATADEALRRNMTTVEKLAVALKREKKERPRGLSFLRGLVHEYQGGDGPCESELESRVLELLLPTGLPRPDRQKSIKVAGRFRRLDFFFEQYGVIIEADGYAYHSDTIAFEKDRERRNSLIARGLVVLQWTWKALEERPDELLQELTMVLKRRAAWTR
jgi:very-short-patch-repair endonuclease